MYKILLGLFFFIISCIASIHTISQLSTMNLYESSQCIFHVHLKETIQKSSSGAFNSLQYTQNWAEKEARGEGSKHSTYSQLPIC